MTRNIVDRAPESHGGPQCMWKHLNPVRNVHSYISILSSKWTVDDISNVCVCVCARIHVHVCMRVYLDNFPNCNWTEKNSKYISSSFLLNYLLESSFFSPLSGILQDTKWFKTLALSNSLSCTLKGALYGVCYTAMKTLKIKLKTNQST